VLLDEDGVSTLFMKEWRRRLVQAPATVDVVDASVCNDGGGYSGSRMREFLWLLSRALTHRCHFYGRAHLHA
jgi:hypothetical protein